MLLRWQALLKKKKKEREISTIQYNIYISSRRNYLLLRIIFNLSSPIAPVYIVNENTDEFNEKLYSAITNNTKLPENVLKFTP